MFLKSFIFCIFEEFFRTVLNHLKIAFSKPLACITCVLFVNSFFDDV